MRDLEVGIFAKNASGNSMGDDKLFNNQYWTIWYLDIFHHFVALPVVFTREILLLALYFSIKPICFKMAII